MYESKSEPLADRTVFVSRMVRSICFASLIVSFSLATGVFGYRYFARLGWIDSLLNASMILTGMGPVDPMPSVSAKVFASLYALFSGVVFLSVPAIILTPLLHRALHHFHLDLDD